jgi:hypothetical protein
MSGISVAAADTATSGAAAADVEPVVGPVGDVEVLKWYAQNIYAKDEETGEVIEPRRTLSLAELHALYPVEIKLGSFTTKMNKLRKFAKAKQIKLPKYRRSARTGSEVDIDALAAELNLERLLDDEDDSDE